MASKKDHTPTSSELFSSAKLVAEAAKSTYNNEGDKVEKGKVAGAAGDLLDAAKDYGKLEQDKGIGQYVDKAENYLHQYESSQTTTTPANAANSAEEKSEPHASGGDGKDSAGSGGVGDYFKMAQGFLKK